MTTPVKIETVQPYYLKPEDQLFVESYLPAMREMSSRLWTYFGYSGLGTPWFYDAERKFVESKVQVIDFIRFLNDADVSFYAYCILTFPFRTYESYQSLGSLFSPKSSYDDLWSYLRKLRSYVQTKENLDKVAHFMELFFEQQIQYNGKAYLRRKSVIQSEEPNPHLEGYHRVFDRICQIEQSGASYEDWVKAKFSEGKKAFNDELNFRALINVNKLDPDLGSLAKHREDPWTPIKEFLGLDPECKIVDGYIPKGWMPSNADFRKSDKIVEVRGDGFYFYADGSQTKGRCHYLSNTYYGIKCDPTNFHLFKASWKNPAFLIKTPTWDEYRKWAIHPGIWGEDGKSLSGIVKSVKWRKK